MTKPFVAILMGSDSDFPVMQATTEILASFGIAFEVKVSSAHRTPERTLAYVKDAEKRGCAVFICAAGLAAHLAGTVAAHTLKPVLGVPLEGGSLQGMDSLLSTVQMPAGIPVGCVAIGKAGAQNAGFLSAQILALQDAALYEKLIQQRQNNAKKIAEKDAALQEKIALTLQS
ncbi:MAG: 5-(carboxyamino)imidazole ribonucleotide mutase [Gammaproteobacteria bacterium 39-13]|nr:5-(carboxyamino)imidazole ribonucleotide mutase [Gammaproteobacteria bacterium]OJV90732.1 MAG: 5-(carboxyamino)imidazole ribonucleotide mutase [Gammaproteobacteria bacterium 39-13]